MKKLLLLLFLFPFAAGCFSQSLSEQLSDALYQVGKDIPSDQLFLHLDRNLYHPGDTIRFQAYIRDSRTGLFGTESSTLYALIINTDHVTIDSARFRITYPVVPGWLVIPEKILPGDYSVLAFTSSDFNFSPKYAFSTPVRIDNLIRALNEPKQKVKTLDSTRYYEPLQEPKIDLRFLPEGGTFIYGIKQRVAFNAVTSAGREMEVSGEITNQQGVRICDFKSIGYGPGFVEFTPKDGDKYFASITGKEFKGMKWPLPSPEKSGVSLQVNNSSDGMMSIILRGRKIEGRSYFLTITMNNVLVFSEDIKIDTLFRKKMQTDKLPSGTAYISLYDNELNPVAERLIFLNDCKKMNIKIETSAPFFFKGDETELTVTTTDEAGDKASSIVSVAVIDSASGYSSAISQAEIESTYLYDREFYDKLPLRIKSRGLKNIDSKSMDILLMTYGWRKFTPREVVVGSDMELINYDYFKITNQGPENKGRMDINLISDASPDVISLPVNSNREVVLYYDSLDPNVRQIMILPDKIPSNNVNPVRIEFSDNNDYTNRAKLLANFPAGRISDLPFTSSKHQDLKLDGYIMIEPVTIKAPVQPIKVHVDKNAKMYQSTGAKTLYSEDFVSATSFEDILYQYNPYRLDQQNKKIYLRAIQYLQGGANPKMVERPALIVVDDSPISDTTYQPIATMSTSQIASVTILRGIQAASMYGGRAIGGVVFVTTKIGSGLTDDKFNNNKLKRNDDLFRQIRLFRTETEFYIPSKEEVAIDPEYQFRPTILWKDNIFIDESGTVKIKYPNNFVKGNAMVFVNGISVTNLIGSGNYSYKVQ